MITYKRWVLPLAVAAGAATGATVAAMSRRRNRRSARALEQTAAVKSWENEGGNLPPPPTAPIVP